MMEATSNWTRRGVPGRALANDFAFDAVFLGGKGECNVVGADEFSEGR